MEESSWPGVSHGSFETGCWEVLCFSARSWWASSERDARESVVCPHVNGLVQNPPVLCSSVWDSAEEVVRKLPSEIPVTSIACVYMSGCCYRYVAVV